MILKEQYGKQEKLILPNSLFVVIWSVFFSLAIIIYFGSAIFQIGFQTRANSLFNSPTQTGIVICFCFVDSIVYFNIAIIVNGKLIRNRRKNMLGYLQSWLFVTDCLVLIVLLARLGLSIANNKQYFLAISFLDLIICLKFFNIRKYDQILKFYYFDDWSLLLYEFTKHVILLALLCHIVGCVYFLIDVLLIQSMWYPIQNHWLISAQAMPLLYYAPLWQQYLYSFYFSIVTLSTLAYGDITPLNPTQVAFVLIILAFLLMFYVYIFTQIYEVVSWFNRKLIRVKQQRHKITQFLKNFNIPDHLRGRIISQFEFRQSQGEELSKDTFINDISTKLAKSFSSMPYKYDIEKFIPRFIISSGIQNEFFNGALSQKFYTPEEYFSPIQHEKSQSQRWMYFVLSKKVYRTITSGTSKLTEIAEKDRWLGINAFIAAQFDINELWHVEIPTQLIALCFTSFRGFLKPTQANYQKYMQHCHLVLQTGGTSEDMNKCLICWKQCHSSIYCRQYRPQLKRSGGILRKTSRIAQICRLIKESQATRRTHLKRLYKQSRKILNKCAPKMKGKDKCVEINSKISSRLICLREKNYGMFEVVQEWPNYMAKHNIQYYKKSQQQ